MKHEQRLEYHKEIVKYDSAAKYNGRFSFLFARPNRRNGHKCYLLFSL
jgi:hypothetical protein